jgi:hypothetical protein
MASSRWAQEATGSAVVPESAVETSSDAVTDTTERETIVAGKPARKNRKSAKTQNEASSEPTKSRAPNHSSLPPRPKRTPETSQSTTDQNNSPVKPKAPEWQTQKAALKEKFPEGWNPRKRLSPDALAGIRALNAQFPETYTTQALADKFQVSVESIRRILKSKWMPSAEEEQERQERWFRRGMQVWERQAAVGVKPPRKWRREGIVRDSAWHGRRRGAIRREKEWEENEKEVERVKRNYGARGGDGESGNGKRQG